MSNNSKLITVFTYSALIVVSSITIFPKLQKASANIGICGSEKWQRIGLRDSYGNANFADDCKRHDECYDTLGKTKEECDSQFHAGLRDSCKKAYSSSVHVVQRKGCLEIANTYYSGVNRLAGDAYRDAQKDARAVDDSTTSTSNSDVSVLAESRLESRLNGKCLYTGHGGSDNVMVVPCDRGKTAGKDWRLTKNRQLQSVLNGKCLYTGHGGSDNVAVVPCDRGVWKGKQWQLTTNKQLQSVLNGKCLYTGHGGSDNVAVVPCDRGVWKGKQWDGELLSKYSKKI